MDNHSMNQAIEVLLNNFTKHPGLASNTENNVFEILQEFWRIKSLNCHLNETNKLGDTVSDSSLISYEFLEKPSPPYVCFCTLPNGVCFATFQNVMTKTEARKNAALISLMNSVFNDHPLRVINEEFINKSLDDAQTDFPNICSLSLQLYKRLLETCLNKTMLEFKQMMTVFQLLQWNGSIKAMRERNCHLNAVIEYYKNFKIDENMRTQMSIDWIDKEQKQPGIIVSELRKVNNEIEISRLRGQELRFLKEKRNILLLASYQFDIEIKDF